MNLIVFNNLFLNAYENDNQVDVIYTYSVKPMIELTTAFSLRFSTNMILVTHFYRGLNYMYLTCSSMGKSFRM